MVGFTNLQTGHRPSQFKKLCDALPIFCPDKNYSSLDEVLCTGYDQVEGDFMPAYPNATLWSHTHQIQFTTVADWAALVEGSLTERVINYELVNKSIFTDANLNKQLLSEYKRNSKLKSQEYSKFLQDKKSLITTLYGQCDEATQTKIALRDNYTDDQNEGRLLAFVEQLHVIYFGSNNGGLSYPPYKQVVAVKSSNTYTNNEVHDPNGFKDQVKIKYKATKAIV